MARFLSQVYTTIRGSVGGITYTANQFQALIARARVSPVNPQTVRQTAMRSAFSGAAQRWKIATNAVRTGWNDYAATCVFTGPLGSYTIPGRQMFIGCLSTAIYLQGLGAPVAAITDVAPTTPGFLDVELVFTSTFTPVGIGIAYTMTLQGTEAGLAYCSRTFAFDGSRYRCKGPFLSSTLAWTAIPAPVSIIQNFSGLTVDKIYFTNPRAITAQPPFRLSATYNLRHIAVEVVP